MRQVKDGIWVLQSEVKLGPGIYLPLQSSVVRLADGALLIYSPTAYHEDEIAAIRDLGEVRHIVAPSLYHHLFFGAACDAFPDARRWGADGLTKKRPDLTFDGTPQDCPAEVAFVRINGMPDVNEYVMIAHDTLFCADLYFNVHRPKNAVSSLVFRLAGTLGRFGISRIFTFHIKDRDAYRESVHGLLAQSFDAVVPCHGDPILSGAHALCAAAAPA